MKLGIRPGSPRRCTRMGLEWPWAGQLARTDFAIAQARRDGQKCFRFDWESIWMESGALPGDPLFLRQFGQGPPEGAFLSVGSM